MILSVQALLITIFSEPLIGFLLVLFSDPSRSVHVRNKTKAFGIWETNGYVPNLIRKGRNLLLSSRYPLPIQPALHAKRMLSE